MTEKMTNKKALTFVLESFELPADVKEKLEKMLVQVEKKNSAKTEGKLTPTQIANEGIKTEILDFLATADRKLTISEMLKEIPACAELTNQRVSALVRQLVTEGKVVRTEEKRKAYFSIAE